MPTESNAITEVRDLVAFVRKVKGQLPPRLLDLAGAAHYLAMSDKAVRKLIQCGELPYIQRVAGRSPYLVDVRDLDRWIERSKTPSKSLASISLSGPPVSTISKR
jgi:excisionase family DNA binding protein